MTAYAISFAHAFFDSPQSLREFARATISVQLIFGSGRMTGYSEVTSKMVLDPDRRRLGSCRKNGTTPAVQALDVYACGEPIIAENMTTATVEDGFEWIRERAAQGNLMVVRSDGRSLILPALSKDSVNLQMIASVEQTIPSTVKRNVAVIADTTWAEQGSPNIQDANQAIPFFGMLMGFTFIGHSVWVFNGSANLLGPGCQNADLLIVDSALLAKLEGNWKSVAQRTMRNPQIVVHDRATYKLRNLF